MDVLLDWTEGLEIKPIHCVSKEAKKSSKYVTTNIPGPGADPDLFETQIMGCSCTVCDSSCTCTSKFGQNYDDGKLLAKEEDGSFFRPVFECNGTCSCSPQCSNRLVQHGVRCDLELSSSDHKGLCLRTKEDIPKGAFVCEYAGEIISKEEAKKRFSLLKEIDMNFILCVYEHYGNSILETYVDPQYFGNIGRYINHSCVPNLQMIPVRIDLMVPSIALFSLQDIRAGEELTYNYGHFQQPQCKSCHSTGDDVMTSRDGGPPHAKLKRCYCDSKKCKGYLPYDQLIND